MKIAVVFTAPMQSHIDGNGNRLPIYTKSSLLGIDKNSCLMVYCAFRQQQCKKRRVALYQPTFFRYSKPSEEATVSSSVRTTATRRAKKPPDGAVLSPSIPTQTTRYFRSYISARLTRSGLPVGRFPQASGGCAPDAERDVPPKREIAYFCGNTDSFTFAKTMDTSIEDLRALVAQSILSTEAFKNQIAASQEAADRRAEEADRRAEEADRLFAESKAEAEKRSKEIDRQLKELGKQIGGLGNKFGSFTEGLALPSVETLLFDTFQIDEFHKRWKKRIGDKRIEIDGLGLVNGARNEGYVVEVKSHLDMRAVEQVLEIMHNIRTYFPAFADKTFYAMIAAADVHEDAFQAAVKEGLYVVGFADELMTFSMPEGFIPKAF